MLRKIVEVKPNVELHGERNIFGTVTPVALSCGHVKDGNASMMWTVGTETRCWICEEEFKTSSRAN